MAGLLADYIYYGFTFIVMAIMIIVNLWFIVRRRDNVPLLIMFVSSYILYCLALYHVNYIWDSIDNVLAYSAKRFMFCFVPLAWFYFATNKSMVWLFEKIDRFIEVKE